jgi:tetratricopeptide (TPR) repeat protein
VLHDLLGLANTFESQEQIDKAVSTWQQVIQNCEDKELTDSFPLIFALFKLATAWMAKKDFAAAVALLQRSLAMAEVKFGRNDAQTSLIRQTLLDALTKQGNFKEARDLALNESEAELRQRIEAHPRDARALNEYGLFLKNERNDFVGAERCYRQAIESVPNDAIVIANLAVLLTTVFAKHEEAEKLYRRALEIAPTDASILGNFANLVHNALRKYDEAAQLYQMSLQCKPGDAAVLANYAALLVQQGTLGEATLHVDQAWKLQSGRHDRISARILFVKATIETLQRRSPDLFLRQLKTLFRQGISHAARVVGVIVEHLKEKLAPDDFVLFSTIARSIGDKAVLPELESIEKWKALKDETLDASWETVTEI